MKRSKTENRLEDWEEKVLHGQYLRQTKEVRSDQYWAWLQNGDLKREAESLTVAAQNQSIRTNLVKARFDKSQRDSLCRICGKVDESIDHIVSGCSKLAQKEYKRRHKEVYRREYIEEVLLAQKKYIGSFVESVILKLGINGMNMSQKVF